MVSYMPLAGAPTLYKGSLGGVVASLIVSSPTAEASSTLLGADDCQVISPPPHTHTHT